MRRLAASPRPDAPRVPPAAPGERTRRRAFTLVELLVVIGIVAVLVAVLLPALNSARRRAKRIKASSDVRQLMLAYAAYHTDNRGWLLWGFPPKKVGGSGLRAYDPVTGANFDATSFQGPLTAQRYPLRLAAYFSGIWPMMLGHADPPDMTRKGDPPGTTIGKAYAMSLSVAYGINAAYVGGTYVIQYPGFDGTEAEGNPVFGRHCVFKANEVRNATRLIVFAESQTPDSVTGYGNPAAGLHVLLPPRANGRHWWTVDPGGRPRRIDAGSQAGLPQGRYGDRTVIRLFDGHVETLPPGELADMRHWCDKATP